MDEESVVKVRDPGSPARVSLGLATMVNGGVKAAPRTGKPGRFRAEPLRPDTETAFLGKGCRHAGATLETLAILAPGTLIALVAPGSA